MMGIALLGHKMSLRHIKQRTLSPATTLCKILALPHTWQPPNCQSLGMPLKLPEHSVPCPASLLCGCVV